VSHFRGSLHRAFPPYPPSLNERNNPKRIAHPARPPIVIVSLPRGHLMNQPASAIASLSINSPGAQIEEKKLDTIPGYSIRPRDPKNPAIQTRHLSWLRMSHPNSPGAAPGGPSRHPRSSRSGAHQSPNRAKEPNRHFQKSRPTPPGPHLVFSFQKA